MGFSRFGRAIAIGLFLLSTGCGTVRQVTEALVGIERLRFRLQGVSDFRLAGIPLAQKRRVADFSVTEAAQLLGLYRAGKLPAEFTVEVAVINPNDGVGGRRRLPVTLTQMKWRLSIDRVPTVSGVMAQPIEVPPGGESVIVPLQVQLDLMEFFRQTYEDVLQLALGIGGAQGGPSRLTLEVEPVLSTPIGTLRYPQPVTVVDKEFRP